MVLVAMALSSPAAAQDRFGSVSLPAGATVLDVPYLPQDALLCGGASAAMVLRYWGMENVLPTDFSPLVSQALGGMRAHDLAANLADLGWDPILFTGRFDEIRRHIKLGRPVITLIEVAGGRFHYVVVTGETGEQLVVHDPAVSPYRLMSRDELEQAWERTGGLSLLVLPLPGRAPNVRESAANDEAERPLAAVCRLPLSEALDLVKLDRLAEAAAVLSDGECAAESVFRRELAGIRLRQRDLDAATRLSLAALDADPLDSHAAEILATALYLDDAPGAALDAWNRVSRPTIDLIRIAGLVRTAHDPVERLVGLRGGDLLTRRSLALARRRLADLPAAAASRVGYVPTGGGRADVVAGIAERQGLRTAPIPLAVTGLRTALGRQLALTAISPLGGGETWSAAWRWWDHRPRVSFVFAGPAEFGPPATWTMDVSWERESFQTDLVGAAASPTDTSASRTVDERKGGVLGALIWVEPWLRARLRGGVERWDGRGSFIRSGVGFDTRTADDRFGLSTNVDRWNSTDGQPGFGRISADAAFRSRASLQGTVLTLTVGVETVDKDSPPTLWPGAGTGFARQKLLRAHPLLEDGVITGPAFDRQLATGGAEIVYWFDLGSGFRVGGAGFIDLARTWGVRQAVSFTDAGIGLRLGSSARDAVLRVDFATSLDDDDFAVSAGWWIPTAFR
jgi:hypothetical protein